MNTNHVWLVAGRRAANVRPMEHEGDYEDGDTLIHITNGIGGVNVRLLPVANDEGTPAAVRSDGDLLVAWLREGADELEKAHGLLDAAKVPRKVPGSSAECTLAARIAMLITEGRAA